MSVKSPRQPLPHGTPRTALPQLQRVLDRQGRTQRWLMTALGESPQQWHNHRDAGGWPDVWLPKIVELLGVPLEVLTAKGVSAPGASETVRSLLEQPEIAALSTAAIQAITRHVEEAVRGSVTETVRLLSDGTVGKPKEAAPSAAVSNKVKRQRELEEEILSERRRLPSAKRQVR